LPLATPGIVAGAMFAFTISLDDVVITTHIGPGIDHAAALYLRPAQIRRLASINALSTSALERAHPAAIAGVFSLRASKRGVGAIEATRWR